MNLIQISEQLKNPAVSVQQLMQYANNSNPEVPSYVALAEMQRRQSMQAPAQAPQQTVKDQLGAELGLPSVAPPGAAPAPQQSPQQPQQMQQPQQVPEPSPTGAPQAPMPEPRQAQPTPGMQPGMAGGGITSIPLNMHHDFAAGGIIAFADGGYPESYALPKEKTDDEIRQEREANEVKYGISKDPYADVKRRYAEIEEKQKASEKNAGFNNVISALAAMGSGKPKRFGESMATYADTATNLEKEQQKASEQNATKMAELHTLFAEREDARRRGDLVADRAAQDKIGEKKKEMLGLQHQYTNAESNKTQAAATASNAATNAAKEAREAEDQRVMQPAKLALYRAQALREGRPPPSIEETNRYMSDPTYAAAYDKMQSVKNGGKGEFTREDAMKLAFPGGVMPGMDPQEGINAANKIYESVNKAKTGGGSNMVTLPDGRSLSFPTAQAAAEFKKKAGIQ
jgi:hypothetical protein